MYITNAVRRAVAVVVLASGAAVAIGTVAAAGDDANVAPDSGSPAVTAGPSVSKAPPGVDDAGAQRPAQNPSAVTSHEVVSGDSYWAIAEAQLPEGATAGELSALATALIDHNSPRLGYDDPAMLVAGDVVEIVPAPAPVASVAALAAPASVAVAAQSHDVVAGESYWAIAESTLDDTATPADVLAKTEELMALNGPRLGYDDPAMLHPGDVVYLAAPGLTPEKPSVEVDATTDAGSATEQDPTAIGAPKSKRTDATWSTRWTRPHAMVVRAQTPASPPLSELALIESESISPLSPATSAIPHRVPDAGPARPAAPVHASVR